MIWIIEVQHIKSKRWVPIIYGRTFASKRDVEVNIRLWLQIENPRATYRAAKYRRVP